MDGPLSSTCPGTMAPSLTQDFINVLRDINTFNKMDKMNKNLGQEETDKIIEDKKFYLSKINNLKVKLTESKIKLDQSYKRNFSIKRASK